MKRFAPIALAIVGVFGSLASIYALPSGMLSTSVLLLSIALTLASVIAILSSELDIVSAWGILTACKALGIRRIFYAQSTLAMNARVSQASQIRIMAVSAEGLVKHLRNNIISALTSKRSFIRVILAEPGSQFVSDIEESESRYRLGQITPEIDKVEKLLSECFEEALSGRSREEVGTIWMGHYTTHLRSSLVLCDQSWGWLTLNLPPRRAVQSASLELGPSSDGLLTHSVEHFDRTWDIVQGRGRAFQIPRV